MHGKISPSAGLGKAAAACGRRIFNGGGGALNDHVMVEDLRGRASAGMDIGGTFIGMHMHPVVVPVHAKTRHIGEANVTMARTRPKYVGGPRAAYDEMPHR